VIELIEANWPLLLVAFLIGLALAFLLFKANRRTRVTGETGDVLDDGASPAARNQALIDSGTTTVASPPRSPDPVPSASPTAQPAEQAAAPQPVVPPTPTGLAGTGAAVASAAATTQPAEDDLTRIKGVGPKLAARLAELEVTGFEQISGWDEAEIDRIDAELGRFQGRIRRDNWVEQARFLAKGDTAGYEGRFGRLD
jgi:predicted flap endonuclease-1-like 5' DNA nuclease